MSPRWGGSGPLRPFDPRRGYNAMRRPIAILAACLLAPVLIVGGYVALAVLHGPDAPYQDEPPALAALHVRHDRIRVDMTEAEVDAVLTGYTGSFVEEKRKDNGADLHPLPRPSAYTKVLTDKPDAKEGDGYLMVYFDSSYRVVGKRFGVWLK